MDDLSVYDMHNLTRHQAKGLAIKELQDNPKPRKGPPHVFTAKELYLPAGYEVLVTYELRPIQSAKMPAFAVAEEAIPA